MSARKEKWRWKNENMASVLFVGRLSSLFPKVSTEVTRTSWKVSFEKGSIRFGMGDALDGRGEEEEEEDDCLGRKEEEDCCLGREEEEGRGLTLGLRGCFWIGSPLLARDFHKLALECFFGALEEAAFAAVSFDSVWEGSIERENGLLIPSIDWVLDSEVCFNSFFASITFPSNFKSLASKFNNLRTLLLLSDSEGLLLNVLLLKGMLTEETPEFWLFFAASFAGLAVALGFGTSTIKPFESL